MCSLWTQGFVDGKIECAKEWSCFMFSELQEWSPYDWFAKWQYIADGA